MIRILVPEWNYANGHRVPTGWFVWCCVDCLMSITVDAQVLDELSESGEYSKNGLFADHSHEVVHCEDDLELAVHYNDNSIFEIFCNTCGWREDLEGVITVLDIEQAKDRHEKYEIK